MESRIQIMALFVSILALLVLVALQGCGLKPILDAWPRPESIKLDSQYKIVERTYKQ